MIFDDGEISIFHTGNIDAFDRVCTAADFEIITYSLEGKIQPRYLVATGEG